MRPATRIEEGRLINNWLRREVRRGYRVGDFWYLIASGWWKQWTDYVAHHEEPVSQQQQQPQQLQQLQATRLLLQSAAALKHGVSDSNSGGNDQQSNPTAVRPRAIDNSCLVATASVKVFFHYTSIFELFENQNC